MAITGFAGDEEASFGVESAVTIAPVGNESGKSIICPATKVDKEYTDFYPKHRHQFIFLIGCSLVLVLLRL
jgi:hypothetical protein